MLKNEKYKCLLWNICFTKQIIYLKYIFLEYLKKYMIFKTYHDTKSFQGWTV